ncbi:DUF4190 domain-containing protein [Dyella sp. C9]|uniref:DUF4190 domain-containing protein n=1 Tax=Dyella sp. C9 TaxID=2202154 RepID=UPI000DEEE45A|nr:DUF4190 domain-containing protein [Dyella sp. C9]
MSYPPSTYRSATTSTLAVVSLLFGIGCWFVLPVIGAIVAVVCGHLARGEIRRATPGSVEGDGLALTGLILGYTHLALFVLAVVLVFSFIALGLSLGVHFLHWSW